MSEQVTEQGEIQDDAAAMASLMAGYNNTARAEQAPAEESTEPSAEPEDIPVIEDQPEPDPEPTVVSLADELKALKAKVASTSSDPETVRRLHGEIGNINRTLKQLQSPAKAVAAPVEDELTAALRAAEESEFPEINAPLVKVVKAMLAKQQSVQQAPENIDEHVTTAVSKIRKQDEQDAIADLADEHPDFETVRDTPEFKAWEKTKTPEFQKRLRTTWNPAVVAKSLTEFKDSLKLKQKKQDRLAAAVVTPGASQQAKSSTLPDEEGLLVGYNKGPKRLNSR